MTYNLTIVQKPTYLHAIVTGRNTKENVARYLADVLRECTARNCRSVLLEERLEGPRLGILPVFDLAAQADSGVGKVFKAMAYVDVNAEGDLMQFAETVAVNRGFPVKVFATVADAEYWLLHKDRGGSEPLAPAAAGQPGR
jgi:hypothetical protein